MPVGHRVVCLPPPNTRHPTERDTWAEGAEIPRGWPKGSWSPPLLSQGPSQGYVFWRARGPGGQMEELRHLELGDGEGWEGPSSTVSVEGPVLDDREEPRGPLKQGLYSYPRAGARCGVRSSGLPCSTTALAFFVRPLASKLAFMCQVLAVSLSLPELLPRRIPSPHKYFFSPLTPGGTSGIPALTFQENQVLLALDQRGRNLRNFHAVRTGQACLKP